MPWIKSTTTRQFSQDISLIQAQYQEFAFSATCHFGLHIGLQSPKGSRSLSKGTSYHAGAGQVVMMPPDELQWWSLKARNQAQVSVFSVPTSMASGDLAGHSENGHTLSFSELILSDQATFLQLRNLHGCYQSKHQPIAQDCLPFEGFSTIVDRYAQFDRKLRWSLALNQ